MKTKFQRLIFLAAMFLIAPFHFSEVASSDPPPAILGLDVPCNGASYKCFMKTCDGFGHRRFLILNSLRTCDLQKRNFHKTRQTSPRLTSFHS